MSEWLDTETRAILQGVPPEKLAPPDTVGFTLVLLSKTNDQERLRQAFARAVCTGPAASDAVLTSSCPQVVAIRMTAEDAMIGQFEFACCDSAAVFIRDEVVADNDKSYLSGLYLELSSSEEFQPVVIEVYSVPNDDQGRRYVRQFLGVYESLLERARLPLHQTVMKKKARVMRHWGMKIGADVRMASL